MIAIKGPETVRQGLVTVINDPAIARQGPATATKDLTLAIERQANLQVSVIALRLLQEIQTVAANHQNAIMCIQTRTGM